MAENNTAARVLELARGELGATSGDKYIRYYNEITGAGLPLGCSWCAAWVTWIMRHAGVPLDSVLNYKGCTTGVDWFIARGRFYGRGSGYTPKPGDIVMYEWRPGDNGTPSDDGADHTGIVERVENGKIYTLEGNNGGICCRDWWSVWNEYIEGYCVPLYNVKTNNGKDEDDMTDEQVRKITREEIAKSNPEYKTVAAVPAYWRNGIQELVDMGVLQGGGKGNLELKRSEAKAMVVCLRMLQLFVGKQYATFEELPEWAKPYIQQLIDRGTLDGVEVKEDGTRVLNLNTILIRLAKMLADEPIEKAE